MPFAPPEFLRLAAAYQRGDQMTVLAEGEHTAEALARRPDAVIFARELSCMLGTIHLASERYELGCALLERGLPAAGTTTDDRFVGRSADRYTLALLDAYERMGRYDDALARLSPLLEPDRPIDVRFGATRAQSSIAALRGDHETAHFLLNTATGLSLRMKSRFRAALVDGDRSVLLASQGRLYEGVSAADRIMPLLVRPPAGDYQLWGNAVAAAVALTIARLAANADDLMTSQRLLIQASTAVERAGSGYLHAHLHLARGAYATAEGAYDDAETALFEAQRGFGLLGIAPGSALTTLEQARLARRRGLHLSAGPLSEQALAEFRALGQPREANDARQVFLSLSSA